MLSSGAKSAGGGGGGLRGFSDFCSDTLVQRRSYKIGASEATGGALSLTVALWLAGKFCEREPASRYAAEHGIEAASVVEFAKVEREGALIEIPEEVESFDADVRPVQSALERLQKFSIPLV